MTLIKQSLLWTPRAKQRPRTAFKQGNYRTFTPRETHLAEEALAAQWMGAPILGPIAVELSMWDDHIVVTIEECPEPTQPKLRRGDIDNYSKLILDGLQSHAYANDRQIAQLMVVKN